MDTPKHRAGKPVRKRKPGDRAAVLAAVALVIRAFVELLRLFDEWLK